MRAPVGPADLGLYVHWPYCERKCPYCDFNVHAVPHDDAAYTDALLAELADRAPAFGARPLRSIYFGGGTPSEWAPAELARFLAGVRSRHALHPAVEITLEANPGTLAEERLDAFAAAGINRLSIGAQSFAAEELALLGRNHDAAATDRLARAAQARGLPFSLDLIYALPGQDRRALLGSLDRALSLGPGHLSAYTLTIEPDTTLGRKAAVGRFTPLEDDAQAELITALTGRLQEAGFTRYEVSSYARPGQAAVHNSLYWVGAPYLGLGAGAHSYLPAPGLTHALRRENLRAPEDYLATTRAGLHQPSFEERLSRKEALGDRLLVGLRTCFGLDLPALEVEARIGDRLRAALDPALAGLAQEGLVSYVDGVARPTARGFLFVDLIAKRLMGALAARLEDPPPPP